MAPSIRRRRPAPITPTPHREGMRASAQRYELKGKRLEKKQGVPRRAWQDEAWAYFDDVPELKYSVWFMGNVMAKVRLFPAVKNPGDPEAPLIPLSDPQSGIAPDVAAKAQAELDRLKGDLGGQGEIIRALNMNLEVAGEGYLIGWGPYTRDVRDEMTGQVVGVELVEEQWAIYSVSQFMEKGDNTYEIIEKEGDSQGRKINPELDTIIRIWQRHPRWSLEADCAMRGVVSDCEALTLLTNSIKADAKSRMSAGILLLPNGLRKGPIKPQTEPDGEEEATVDQVTEMLYIGYTEPVEDPASAAAVAPTFLFGEKDDLEAVRHLTMERPGDDKVLDKIKMEVDRIARGTNLPVEVVMGHQQTTFANALQVKQDTFDDHFEPRCDLIVDVFAIAFLQPNLIDLGVAPEIAERILVGYDPSKMIRQASPVDSADTGVEIGAIGRAAWRRVKGWSEDDQPDEGEAPPAKQGFGAPTAPAEQAPVEQPAPSDNAEPIAASRSDRNVGFDLMLLDRELRARLIVAADLALNRALELAGNRLRSKAGKMRELSRAGKINPVYVAATLGPTLVAAAGIADDDLISGTAWASLGGNFATWVEAAQARALTLAGRVVPITPAQRTIIEQRQAADRAQAWEWLQDQLHTLAHERLYAPDPAVPAVGESDPSSRVPAGLIRQALARAGGATGLTAVVSMKPALRAAGDPFVAVNNDEPAGGIGLGEAIMSLLDDGGAGIEGYEWVYGPAYRLHPFEEHEALDGEVFVNFDDDVLVAGDWTGDYYFPGDHDGCNCDIAPTIVEAAAFADSAEAAGLTELGDVSAPEEVSQEERTNGRKAKR